jgi:uncharacterized protein YegL
LTLSGLAPHTSATVSFDLFIIRSWDGTASPPYGPDTWGISADGSLLLQATFSNVDAYHGQTYCLRPTPTPTPTDTPTATPTNTPTDTPTATPTATPTDTPTATPTNTPTDTPTATPTNTPTDTPTATPTNTPTDTPRPTNTPTPTFPVFEETTTPTPTSTVCVAGPADIVLVLDRSYSFTEPGSNPGPTKLHDLKAAVKAFLNDVNFAQDRVAIVSFNDTATINVSLTNDKATLDAAVDALVASGLTNYEDALAKARTEIVAHRRPEASPVIIMLTDGRQTVGGSPLDEANDLKNNLGVQIFTMGLGLAPEHEAVLKEIASDPDSTYFRSLATSAELASAYNSILRTIECGPQPTSTPAGERIVDTYFIAAGSDDAYSRNTYCTVNSVRLGDVAGEDITAGVRFLNVQKRAGKTLVDARLEFPAAANGGALSLRIFGHNTDNAATFACGTNPPHTRPVTGAAVDWTTGPWTAGSTYTTPNIAAVVNEVLSRPGWVNGNALALLIRDNGSTTNNQARNFEMGAPYIRLVLTWQ